MDSSAVIYTPFQPLANPPSCITALYLRNAASIVARCSLQVRKAQTISIPMFIALFMASNISTIYSNDRNNSCLP